MTYDVYNELKFPANEICELFLDQIEPDEDQIRKEFKADEIEALAESIKHDGQIQPILVTQGQDGKYKIVDGERRWRALNKLAEQAGAGTEPAHTIRAMYTDEDNRLVSILGNIVRNNYNPMETADAIALIKRMIGKDAKDLDVAKRIGKSRSIIVEYNSLLNLPIRIQEKARADSCVPFHKLKVLAADKRKSDQEKIAEYDKLHEQYATEREKAKKKKTHGKALQTTETRAVVAVRKKLDEIRSALDSVHFGDKVDGDEKEQFIKSLEEIVEIARATLQRLS